MSSDDILSGLNKTMTNATIISSEKIETKLPQDQKITMRDRAYRLQYRYKNRFQVPGGKVQEKVFWFKGNLKEAVTRAREHCDIMDYTFIFCYPYIVDLDAQEELKGRDTEGIYQDEY